MSDDILTNPNQWVSLLDLTRLAQPDNISDFTQWLQPIYNTLNESSLGSPAAICCEMDYLPAVKNIIGDWPAALATVVNFPSGTVDDKTVLSQISSALTHGATEIDVVVPYQKWISGDRTSVVEAIRAYRKASCDVILKVIVESGAFDLSADKGRADLTSLCQVLIDERVDFIKTSTGKIAVGATKAAVNLICGVIAANKNAEGFLPVGLKISGGLSTITITHAYLDQVAHILGVPFLNNRTFRIGASRLLSEILQVKIQ